MAAPILDSYDIQNASVATTATTFDSAGDISVNAGDLVVACGASSNGTNGLSFSGGGLTWTERISTSVQPSVTIWTAVATTTNTFVATMTRDGSQLAGLTSSYFVFRSGAQPGAVAWSSGNTFPSPSISTTSPHSAIVMFDIDAGVAAASSATWLTNAGSATTYQDDVSGTDIFIHSAIHHDVTSAGTYTIGQSAPSGQFYDFVALEVLGTNDNTATTSWFSA